MEIQAKVDNLDHLVVVVDLVVILVMEDQVVPVVLEQVVNTHLMVELVRVVEVQEQVVEVVVVEVRDQVVEALMREPLVVEEELGVLVEEVVEEEAYS